MGANYDVLVSLGTEKNDLLSYIRSFLQGRGMSAISVLEITSADVDDDKAILVSPSSNGRALTLATCSSLNISMKEWFVNNPLATFLSRTSGSCIHLWSLDSGYVVGYSVYKNGTKVECDAFFSKYATDMAQIADGVPVPPRLSGHELAFAIDQSEFDLASYMTKRDNLEKGLAELVSDFGFDVQLVDIYEALEEKVGIALRDDTYVSVPLSRWLAMTFTRT